MVAKLCLPVVLLASTLALSQTSTSVAGTVKSRRTGLPVGGAVLRLAGNGLSATTDSLGRFSITTGPSSVGKPGRNAVPMVGSDGIPHRQAEDGQLVVRILSPSGQLEVVAHSGWLAKGDWRIPLPALRPGVHVCVFETAAGRTSTAFLSSGTTESDNGGAHPVAANARLGRSAAVAVDTLVASRSGFRTARIALESYRMESVSVLLDDSGSIDVDQATIVPDPSWTCFMPDGIPPPALGTLAFRVTLQIAAVHQVGVTKFGRRTQYDIGGGSIKGDRIDATALSGGLDYELGLSTGSLEVEQIVILKAGSTPILMRNAGVAPSGSGSARVVLDFEAPNSSAYAWLNSGKYAAIRVVDTVAKTIRMDVYDIAKVSLPATKVQIEDPAGTSNQTWECLAGSGSQGASVFTETALLGSSISIGASKRGSRNIIPITGGTMTGKVSGTILSGGADYQLSGLDARYTLQTSDGEFIIVRNCGAGQLIPVFETRSAGPYAFLNENKYLSSGPNMVTGGVSITFYEKK